MGTKCSKIGPGSGREKACTCEGSILAAGRNGRAHKYIQMLLFFLFYMFYFFDFFYFGDLSHIIYITLFYICIAFISSMFISSRPSAAVQVNSPPPPTSGRPPPPRTSLQAKPLGEPLGEPPGDLRATSRRPLGDLQARRTSRRPPGWTSGRPLGKTFGRPPRRDVGFSSIR